MLINAKSPPLNNKISINDFRDYYCYKTELVDFYRVEKLNQRSSKIELNKCIITYLTTREKENYKGRSTKAISLFYWNNEELTVKTIITDNYKNTENVRSFFKSQLGDSFRFNVKFMNWMKTANGKNLGYTVKKWIGIKGHLLSDDSLKDIAPQFEYNTYIRDFLKENPKLNLKTAIECWKVKKYLKGNNIFNKNDLEFINNIK